MSLSHPSPLCTVGTVPTIDGVNVAPYGTISIELADTAGVKLWGISCINTDELLHAADFNADLTIDTVAKTASFTAPARGSALIFQSVVNNGRDANGVPDPTLTTTFGVYVLTTSSYRVAAFDEATEGDSAFGWITKINQMIRAGLVAAASAGDGMVFSAGAYNVVPNADGSIVVSSDDVKVGVLATDAQHGVRGGGTQHAAATDSVNGFQSSTHCAAMNAATSNATADRFAKRDGSGGCRFAALLITTLGCSGITNSGNATHAGTLGVTGATTLAGLTCTGLSNSGNASHGGTLTVTGAVTCSSTLSAAGLSSLGAVTRTGVETLSGTGAYRNIRPVICSSIADTSYDARTFDIMTVPALGGNRVHTLSALGAADRVLVTIERYSNGTSFSLTIKDQAAATIATYAAGSAGACQFYWNGTTWIALFKNGSVT